MTPVRAPAACSGEDSVGLWGKLGALKCSTERGLHHVAPGAAWGWTLEFSMCGRKKDVLTAFRLNLSLCCQNLDKNWQEGFLAGEADISTHSFSWKYQVGRNSLHLGWLKATPPAAWWAVLHLGRKCRVLTQGSVTALVLWNGETAPTFSWLVGFLKNLGAAWQKHAFILFVYMFLQIRIICIIWKKNNQL